MTVPVIEGAEAWRAEGDEVRGHVGVVVVHGFTGNPVSTRPLGEHLHVEGFTVEVLRLPGHGTNPRDMATTRYGDWLAAVEQAYDDLAARCEHVVLVGLSMGGTLSLDVAARRDVAGVVAINAPILDRPGILPKLAGVVQHLVPMLPPAALDIAENDIKGGGDEQAYDRVPTKAAYSLARALPRVRAQLRSLHAPALVVWSREDHTVPTADAHAIAAMLPGDVRTLELADSYHVATLDLDQELLFAAVSDFVAEATGV